MRYNVLTRVISIVEADSPEEARTKAEDQITRLLSENPEVEYAEVFRARDRATDVDEIS